MLLPAALSGQSAQGRNPAPTIAPAAFYIVEFEGSSLVITEVQPVSQADSKVRFIEFYPACGSYRVQENDHVFENVSVQELTANADICAPEQQIAGLLDQFKRKKNDETWWHRQGIAAQCGTRQLIHHLPAPELLRFVALKAKSPGVAALWTISQEIQQRYTGATGKNPLLRGLPMPREVRLKRLPLVEQAVIELRNGDFDLGAPELPDEWRPNGESKLSELVPEVAEATAPEDYGVVENLDHLGIEKYEDVPYPTMAKIAHITGDVALDVSIDPVAGSVINVIAKSGHPILKQAATDAVAKWVFVHPYSGLNPLPVKVHFVYRCSPTIQTQATTVKSASKKPKKKPKK